MGHRQRVCEPGKLVRRRSPPRTIAANAPLSVRQIKKSVRYGGQMELRTAFRFEIEAYNHLVDTEDRYEGVRAFNEKRKAVFKGNERYRRHRARGWPARGLSRFN